MNDSFFCIPPTDSESNQPYPVIRARVGVVLAGVCWSDEPVGAFLHWYRGRTVPCSRDEFCPACADSIERRYESYVWFEEQPTARMVIVAFPYLASRWLWNMVHKPMSLEGRFFEITRKGTTKRSQVAIKVGGHVPDDWKQPRVGCLRSTLNRLWGVDASMDNATISRPVGDG